VAFERQEGKTRQTTGEINLAAIKGDPGITLGGGKKKKRNDLK